MPKVITAKPSVPTIWLDTSVGIKLAKLGRGEALQEIEIHRLKKLEGLVTSLVKAGKLLCPEADQEEEYEAERLERDVAAKFTELSLGIRIRHRLAIFDSQIFCAMHATCARNPAIELPVQIYFHGDPVQQLSEARKREFLISVNLAKDVELIARKLKAKEETMLYSEALRKDLVAKGQTFKAQFDLERQAHADTMLHMLQDFARKVKIGGFDFWDFMGVTGWGAYLATWKRLNGQPAGIEGLYEFLRSDYLSDLPICSIHAQLYADLLTRNEEIRSGDTMDVQLLSVAIPLCHFVLTDRNMEVRIKRLGIDKDWGTGVFSMASIEGLFAELERIEAS